jgi:5-(carboxyamino)imidazole ribonucleotide mutase
MANDVAIIMGSVSDMPVMQASVDILTALQISHEVDIVSAHRTPEKMVAFAKNAANNGFKVIIAGAGGAAHLPGMVASLTDLPVIGVPVESKAMRGIDSLYSIVQMPGGVPVATMAINGAKNAGLMAARILGVADKTLQERLTTWREAQRDSVLAQSVLEPEK